MASTYSDLKFELIGTGDQSGTWGTTTNDNIGTAIEQAITGFGNPIFTTDANLTITLTNTVALQTARALVLNATSSGSLTATRELVVPTIEKQYIVQNNTTGSQSITVKTSAGTGITVPNGKKMHLYVDGVNVVDAVSHFSSLTLAAALPVLSGGTGVTTSTGSGNNVLSTSPTLVTPILGTPTSVTLTNATGLPLTTGVTGLLPVANGGSGTATPAIVAGTNVTVSGSWPNQTINATGSGDVVGPGSATDNALARFDLATGKLIQNSVGILSDAGALTGLTGITSSGSITFASLTAGRVTYAGTAGLLVDSASLTFDGTTLTAAGFAGPLNGTVGATTANTGAFTTLSATGVATFSAGTVSLPAITTTGDTNTGIFFPAADTIAFAEGGAEAMRIDSSGNVGIGTTSPVSKLHVYGTGQIGTIESSGDYSSSGSGFIRYKDSTGNRGYVGFGGTSNLMTISNTLTSGVINFETNGSERMRIDSSGKVGVGTVSATSLLQTAGSSSVSAFKTPNIAEVNTVSATAATGTINYDVTTQSVLYYTSNASGNFTVNFRGSSGTTLNTVMSTGESLSATFLVTNGATAYYNSAVTVDGVSVTPKWQGGTAPTSGNASSIDSYTYVIIKTGSATFTILASQTKFA